MEAWTDFGRMPVPPGGPLLENLISRAAPVRPLHALVLGPHDWHLVDRVVERAERTTIVLRGRADAAEAATRYVDHAVEIVCGDILACRIDVASDLLVALDGLDRTVSVESHSPSWQEVIEHVRSMLTPDSTQLLAIDNVLDLSRMATGTVEQVRLDDAAWEPMTGDSTKPRSTDDVRSRIPGGALWVAQPTLRSPTLLSRPGAVPEALVVAHSAAGGSHFDGRDATRRAMRAGRLADLAAGWVAVVGAPDEASALVTRFDNRVAEVRRVGDGFAVVGLGESDSDTTSWTVPLDGDAELLESVLLDASARGDRRTVQQLVELVAESVRRLTDDERRHWFGPLANVVFHRDGSLRLLDHSMMAAHNASADDVAIGLFDDFTRRLFEIGWRHPWPVALGADDVTILVSAMAGIEIDKGQLASLRWRREPQSVQPLVESVVTHDALTRLAEANEALRSRDEWFAAALRQRQVELADLRRMVGDSDGSLQAQVRQLENRLAAIEASTSLRIGRAITKPVRFVVKKFRAGARRLSR
jgi:hypothetical protein